MSDTQETTELVTTETHAQGMERGTSSVFTGISGFVEAQRIASALSRSTIVPEIFQQFPQGKPENIAAVANCLIALEMAQRSRESPLVIMQNLYVVKGKPSFSAVYLIAKVNSSAAFSRLMWEVKGTLGQNDYAVRAYATLLETGELLTGPWITPAMVVAEGWGPKWKTMPEQMYRYRAAAFWSRIFAPDITLGMQTVEEVEDVQQVEERRSSARDLNARIRQDIATQSATDEPETPVDSIDTSVIEEGDVTEESEVPADTGETPEPITTEPTRSRRPSRTVE
jgi:hypothetical protein